MQDINNDRNALKPFFLKVFKITDFKNNIKLVPHSKYCVNKINN